MNMSISVFSSLEGLDSAIDQLCSFCNEITSTFATNTNRVHSSGYSCRGILITGPSSSGKTSILKCIQMHYSKESCICIDMRSTTRFDIEKLLLMLSSVTPKPLYVLIDNIDIFVNSEPDNSSIVSLFIDILDDSAKSMIIISTCTDINIVFRSCKVPYRLGMEITLTYPSISARRKYLTTKLSLFRILGNDLSDMPTKDLEALHLELAESSQGYSIAALNKVISDSFVSTQLHQAAIKDAIIASYLISNVSSISSTSINNDFISSLILDINEELHLANHKHLLQNIINNINMNHPSSSGMVIYGASGTGKTSLAHNIVYACRKTHRAMQVSCAELVHKIVGESEKRLVEIFRAARSMAPCILVLDNLDTVIGIKADDSSPNDYSSRRTAHKALDRLLSCLLIEIDGFATVQANPVFVIATATEISSLDRSLLRPGRLEIHTQLNKPNKLERKELLHLFLNSIPVKEDINDLVDDLVDRTEWQTPAEIRDLVTSACMNAAREKIIRLQTSNTANSFRSYEIIGLCEVSIDNF